MSNNNESAKKLSAKLFAAYETERAMKWLHGQNKEFAEKYPAGTPQPEQGETYWIIKNLLNIISDLKATSPRDWTPCDKGLPEAQDANKVNSPLDYKKYLVTLSYGGRQFVRTVTYLKGHIGIPPMEYEGWCETDNGTWYGAREFITAWQPLPEPYNPNKMVDKKEE